MRVNFSSINNKIRDFGTSVAVTLYSGTDPQFDADQNTINQTTGTNRYALVIQPSKIDLESLGGIVTRSSKKFCFENDFTQINVSDELNYAGGTFVAVEIEQKFTRVNVFANRQNNS